MYLKSKYRNALIWARDRLSSAVSPDEVPQFTALWDLITEAESYAVKNAENARRTMAKYRSTPEGKAKSRESSRKATQKWRANNK